MNDAETSVAELRAVVERFVAERDWQQFHTPKNLSMSLSVEVAELMEHFQWRTPEESAAIAQDPELLTEVAHEMADVACYLLALSSSLGVDLSSAIEAKMVLNRKKYPAEKSSGQWAPPKA
ncbi:nucleotide pyrophosphohydrolase [Rosistilla oblonga]|uniref:nucleotide pyrophosphohydrolase n=1 Tax=Rosistilla oblonga TaxID=2527990 RepID=UPI003A978B52